MSYCRWSDDSDVYLYAHVSGGWECCGCSMGELVEGRYPKELCKMLDIPDEPFMNSPSIHMTTLQEVLDHLQAHRDAGHQVLERAFDRVRDEIEEYGPDSMSPYSRQV